MKQDEIGRGTWERMGELGDGNGSEGHCIQLLEFTDKAWNVNSIHVVKNKKYKTEKEKERGQDGNMQRSPLSSCYETELKCTV